MHDLKFRVDAAKCVKCGLCVKDCPRKLIHLDRDGDGLPCIPQDKTDRCMRCQHCMAVCPAGALSIRGLDPSKASPLRSLDLPSGEQMRNLLRSRRSVRSFVRENVDPATIDSLLKALANVPTGCNARELSFTCFRTVESMDRLRAGFLKLVEEHKDGGRMIPRWIAIPAIALRRGKYDEFFRGAPHMLVVSADERLPDATTPDTDVHAAMAYFDMLAAAEGLGTCWCGYLPLISREIPEVRHLLGLSPNAPFYTMYFGKPAVRYMRTVQRDDEARIIYRD